jgi:hypothetical protein
VSVLSNHILVDLATDVGVRASESRPAGSAGASLSSSSTKLYKNDRPYVTKECVVSYQLLCEWQSAIPRSAVRLLQ